MVSSTAHNKHIGKMAQKPRRKGHANLQVLLPQEVHCGHHFANTRHDVLNIALFGVTAKEWRDENPDLKGNIRDYAAINELICLSNMENLNAVFINEGLSQRERLIKLNQIAIQQMKILHEVENRKTLK